MFDCVCLGCVKIMDGFFVEAVSSCVMVLFLENIMALGRAKWSIAWKCDLGLGLVVDLSHGPRHRWYSVPIGPANVH